MRTKRKLNTYNTVLYRMILLSFIYSTVFYPIQMYAEVLSSVDFKRAQSTSFYGEWIDTESRDQVVVSPVDEVLETHKERPTTTQESQRENRSEKAMELPAVLTTVYASAMDYGVIGSQYDASDDPSDNFFDITLMEDIDSSMAYYLEYTVIGVNSLTSLARSINGNPALGNNLVRYSTEETTIKERINPDLLVKGTNRIFFNVNNSTGVETVVRQVKIVQEAARNEEQAIVLTNVQRTTAGRLYIRGFASRSSKATLRYKMTPVALEGKKEFEAIFDQSDMSYLIYHEANSSMQKIDISSWLKEGSEPSELYHEVVSPNLGQRFPIIHEEENTISVAGAGIQFPQHAIGENITAITVEKLRKIDLAPQGAGIVNITKGQEGYRFLPDGSTFEKEGVISIAFDPNLVPDGTKDEDIHIFFFDESNRKWVAIPTDQVLADQGIVQGVTDHFTDYIAGVIQMPESPDYSGFTPTGAKNMPAAKPTDKINFVEMPEASMTGDANLSYPIEIPTGRKGMQPNVSLSYSSGSTSSGWVGLGWDLSVPSIEVNTTWGAAIYDLAKESELYSFNGEDLVLLTNGREYAPNRDEHITRVANATFAPRIEGSFQKIERLGSSPSTYSWVVTAKNGTKYYYGSTAQARLTTGIGTQGNIAKWMLEKTEDLNGNYVEYQYELKTFTTGSLSDGKQVYPRVILYTKHANSAANVYKIQFNRTTTIGSAPREDQSFSLRRGVKEVENDLLSEIVISKVQGTSDVQIRKYVLGYKKGAFGKTLLEKVSQMYNNTVFHTHEFDYFNEVANGGMFAPRTNVETYTDFAGTFDKLKAAASAIGGGQGEYKGINGGVYGGYASAFRPKTLIFISRAGTLGVTGFSSSSKSESIISLMDMDGDGLPDKVVKVGGNLFYRKNLNGHFSRVRSAIIGRSTFSKSKTKTLGAGLEVNLFAHASGTKSWTETKIPIYIQDVNNDGLPDIVDNEKVYFNSLSNNERIPVFHINSSRSSNPIFTSGAISVSSPTPLPSPKIPTADVIKIWEAPFNGTVNITGTIRSTTSVAAYYSIEKGKSTQRTNTTFLKTITAVPRTNTATNVNALAVQKGDRLFFRVISSANGGEVAVDWNPKVSYTTSDATYVDANGVKPYDNSYSDGYVLSGFAPLEIKENGTYVIQANSFVVDNRANVTTPPKLSDEVVLVIKRFKLNTSNTASTNMYLPIHAGALIDVYRQRIKLNELNSIPALNYSFTVSNIVGDDESTFQYVKAEIQSSSNVNWSTINSLWHPKLSDASGYFDRELVPELALYNKEYKKQTVGLTLAGRSTFKIPHSISISGCNGNCAQGYVYFTVKNGKGEVQKESATSNQYIKYRFLYNSGTLRSMAKFNNTTGNYDLVAGSITETTFELSASSTSLANKVYFEWYSENPLLAEKLVGGVNTFVLRVVTMVDASGTLTTMTYNVPANVFAKVGNNQFGPMYLGWGAFGYKSKAETRNRTEPIDQEAISDSGAQQGVDENSSDLSESEFRECEEKETYEEYMACVEQKRRRNGTVTTETPPRMYVLFPNKETGRWQLNAKMYASATASNPYNERLNEEDEDPNDPADPYTRDRGVDGTGVGPDSSHSANGVVKYITSVSKGYNVGALVVSQSENKVEGKAINDFRDINGDGYPDILGNQIQLTNEKGGLTSRVIAKKVLQNFDAKGRGRGVSISTGTLVGFIQSIKGETANATPAVVSSGSAATVGFNTSYFNTSDFVSSDLVDLNGDGLPDFIENGGGIALNYGNEFRADRTWGITDVKKSETITYSGGGGINLFNGSIAGGFSISKNVSEDVVSLLDVNGDGLPDKIVGKNQVYLNMGTGFSTQAISLPVSSTRENQNISGGINANVTYCIYFLVPLVFTGPKICFSLGGDIGKSLSKEVVQIMDFDGDGYPDILVSNSEGDLQVAYSKIGKTNLLKSVKRPLGGVISLDYDNKNPDEKRKIGLTYAMPFTKWVMTKAAIFDGYDRDGESTMSRSFSYYKGFKDRRERKFLGFGEIITSELDRTGQVFRSVKDEYLLNEWAEYQVYAPGLSPVVRQYYFKKGLLSRQTMYDKHGRVFSKVQNLYQFFKVSAANQADYAITSSSISFDEKGRYLPLLSSVITSKYEFNGTATTGLENQTRVYFDRYDRYGNVLKYRDVGDSRTVNAADLITVNMTYHYNTATYLVGMPKTHEVIFQGQNRKVESEIDTKGNITGFKRFLSPTQSVNYQFTYDGFGNLTQKKHPMIGNSQYIENISYENVFNMYPLQVENNRGGGAALKYDYLLGGLLEVKVHGLASIFYSYDVFGRLTLITSPEVRSKYTLQNTYNLQYNLQQNLFPYVLTERSATMIDSQNTGGGDRYYQSSLFTDGLGRVIQTKQQLDKTEACPGVNTGYRLAVSGATIYDEFGRSIKTSLPSEEINCSQSVVTGLTRFTRPILDPNNSVEVVYDNIDRPVFELATGINTRTTYIYGYDKDCFGVQRFKKEVILPEGNRTISYFDAKGRMTATQQLNNTLTLCTKFSYNALGNPLSVIDADNKQTLYTYDALGQLTQKTQADRGQTKYTYDVLGQLTSLETSNLRQASQRINYTYNKEQLTKEVYPTNTVEYTYVQDRLTRVKDNSVDDKMTYNLSGDIARQERTVQTPDGRSYTSKMDFTYDFWGRVGSVIYPDAERVIYQYDEGGMLKRIANTVDFEYIKSITYDHYGNRKKVKYGNNVETQYFYSHQQRLRGLTLRRPNNQLFTNILLNYDRNSNITSIKNDKSLHQVFDVGGISEILYKYDGFNRLESSSTSWQGKREKHTASLKMAYNNTHGIVSKLQNHKVDNTITGVAKNTDNQYNANYTYDPVNHQIKNIVYSDFGDQRLNYTQNLRYDSNGNLTSSKKVEKTSNRVLEDRLLYWDTKDQLQAVVVNNQVSFYNYDYTGNRVIKSLGQSQSFAVNGVFNANLSVVDSYVLYPNQYITVEKSGNYTKHYYSGTDKIASALGSGISFGSGNGTYRTQFETSLREVFEESDYDEPQFFTTFNAQSDCDDTLYYLLQQYELNRDSDCSKKLKELLGSNLSACEIVEKIKEFGCLKNCDQELAFIKRKFENEKNEKCLELIRKYEKAGYDPCLILEILQKEGCIGEDCLDEYNSWISFLEEHKRFDCLEMLLNYVRTSGMTKCEAVAYMKEHSDCLDATLVDPCYEKFVYAYEACVGSGGINCNWFVDYLDQIGKVDYCKLMKDVVVPPTKPIPPVEEPLPPNPGNGGTEIDPVIPVIPEVPEPPFRQGRIWWYHSDHLGSSSYLTDINGVPTHYYSYLPFGELMVEHNNSNYDNVYKFNGKELDPQTGYYYYGARYYDPTMSIFLSVDPLAEKFPGWTPYHYVHNNPINLVDPTGMSAEDSTGKDDWFVNNKNGDVIKVGGVSDLNTLDCETLEKYQLGNIDDYTKLGKDDMFGDVWTSGLGKVSDHKNIKMNGDSESFMKENGYYLGWNVMMEEQEITSGGRMGSENFTHKVGSIKKIKDLGYTYAKIDQFYQKTGITEVSSDLKQYIKIETIQYKYSMRLNSPMKTVEPFFQSNNRGMSRDVPLNIVKGFVEALSDLIGK